MVVLVSWFGRASQSRLRSERRTRWVIFFFWLQCWLIFVSGRCWVRRLYCSSCDMHACSRHYIDFPRHGKKVIYLYFIVTLCLYLVQCHFVRSFPHLLDRFTTQSFYCKYIIPRSSYHEKLTAYFCTRPEKLWQ